VRPPNAVLITTNSTNHEENKKRLSTEKLKTKLPSSPAAAPGSVWHPQRFAAEGARVFIIEAIGGPLGIQSLDKVVKHTRNRAAEFQLNGTCLVRAICCGAFRKVPFFLRHLWCALAG
jgi:hypothetical protein